MSKKIEARKKQNYDPRPALMVCMNCEHYKSDMVEYKGVFGGIYFDEKNKRCGLGEFAVKKMGTCNLFSGFYEAKK